MRGLLFICNTPLAAMAFSVLHRPVESAANSGHTLGKFELVSRLKSFLRASAGESVIHLQPRISSVNVIQSPGLDLGH